MWASFLKDTVLKPLFRRLGTVGASALIFGGDWLCQHWNACGLVNEQGANLVMTYVVAVALLCFDLMVGWIERKAIARKAGNADAVKP